MNNSLKTDEGRDCMPSRYIEATYIRAKAAIVVDFYLRGKLIGVEVFSYKLPQSQLPMVKEWLNKRWLGVAMAYTLTRS